MPITVDGLDELHARAALDILNGDDSITVFTGSVPDNAQPPYVLVYTAVAWPDSVDGKTYDGKTGTCVTRWYTHCAGGSDQATRTVANWVRQLLNNAHPTITGRSCGLIQQEASPPPVRDQTTGVLVQDIVSVYTLTTFSAT